MPLWRCFFLDIWYRSDLWIQALAMRHQDSFLLQNRAFQTFSTFQFMLYSYLLYLKMPSLSVLFVHFRVFNSDGRQLCDSQDLFLMEQHMSQVESPIHDPSGVYLSPLLRCKAQRCWFYSWKMNIICYLWKIYDISNTQSAFVETNSYWGRFSQVQSLFIPWLSKHLLQVKGWLGELLQIFGSFSPCRIH